MKDEIKREPFVWKDEYNVNISIIDEQHKKFLDIINELKVIINDNSCKEHVSKIFFQIAYLIDYYFIKEEIYFKDCKYPNLEQHKTSHNQFIERIIQFQKDVEANKPNLCREIYYYLEKWFDEHILKYNKEAVAFLKKSGVN
ncbi:MAG: bacteriohemerythrin [Bacteroidales bacterium]|nr:bacteriohemerythrin [Bacteroidales bacterium]